ncbi:monocarboxylate transporter 2-like [Lineus longissimus]|uniref:monocarboxylate transporter 2-like n=1 Tax=Lineus longissimus TaxID=88925 RepID=UPI00315DAF95
MAPMGETETFSRTRHVSKASQKSGDDSSSSSSSESSDLPMPTPPDGGWGWVIIAASFITNVITDGVAFSFGVLFTELHDHFYEDSHSKITWIGSVFCAIPMLAGPIAGALINKYGCRWTCIAGGIISCVGCVLCVFATSSEILCLTFGVISGVGLSLVYTPGVIIVAFYFEKRRALATGISVSGSGIGTFAMAPLMEYLIQTYGWRGTFLLIGGFFLNLVVCGALFRPLETSGQRKRRKFLHSLERLSRTSRNNSQLNFSEHVDAVNEIEMQLNGRRGSVAVNKIKQHLSEPVTHSLVQLPTYFYKDGDDFAPHGSKSEAHVSDKVKVLFTNSRDCESITGNRLEVPFLQAKSATENRTNGHLSSVVDNTENRDECSNGDIRKHSTCTDNNVSDTHTNVICTFQDDETSKSRFDKSHSRLNKSQSLKDVQITFSDNPPQTNSIIHGVASQPQTWEKTRATLPRQPQQKASNQDRFLPMYRRDIFYRGSLIRLDEFIQNKSSSCPQLYKASDATSDDDESDDRMFMCCQWKHAKRVVKEMLDVSIFRSVKYVLFFLSNVILYAWYDIPYFYVPDYGAHIGLTHMQTSMVVSVIGIANMFGLIFFGLIADSPKVSSSLVYGLSMVICGIAIFFYPLCTTFVTICMSSAVYGFFIGANFSLASIIIVEMLSLEKLTNAYGILMCGQGVANLVGPPIAGLLYDLTQSYLTTFLCAAGFIILSGVLLFIVAAIQFRSNRRLQRRRRENCALGEDAGRRSLMDDTPALEQSAATPQTEL